MMETLLRLLASDASLVIGIFLCAAGATVVAATR